MALFWIDFSASVIVEAETKEKAMERFFFEEKLFAIKKCDYVEVDSVDEIDEPPEN